MRKLIKYFTVIGLISMILWSCKDDKYDSADIQILFVSQELDIDLNILENPPVVAVIKSANNLKKVEFNILKDGNAVEPYGTPVTTFFNPKSYSLNESLVYTEDMVGVRIVATDASGETFEKDLPFKITPILGAPEIVFNTEKIEMNEGGTVPALTASITSQAPLTKINFYKVVKGVQSSAGDPVETFSKETSYDFDIRNLVPENIFIAGITGFKLEAIDSYGKVKIVTIPVNLIELPAPVVTFDEKSMNIYEFSSATITGSIKSSFNLAEASFSLKGKEGVNDKPIPDAEVTITKSDAKNWSFSHTIVSMSSEYIGFIVNVRDNFNKTTEAMLPITVTEAPSPTIALPKIGGRPVSDFYGIASNTQINLADFVVNSPEINLKSFTLKTIALDGKVTSHIDLDNIDAESYTPSGKITADINMSGIIMEAVNMKGKSTIVELPMSVDCWVLKDVLLQERTGSSSAGADQVCVFSSVLKRALSLKEGFAAQADCDFTFYNAGSSGIRQIRISSLDGSHTNINSKYNNAEFGFTKWSTRNSTTQAIIKEVTRGSFFETNADIIKGLAEPTNKNHRSVAHPAYEDIVLFQTVQRNGKIQRGIIRIEGVQEGNAPNIGMEPDANAKINLSIILTTPYVP